MNDVLAALCAAILIAHLLLWATGLVTLIAVVLEGERRAILMRAT